MNDTAPHPHDHALTFPTPSGVLQRRIVAGTGRYAGIQLYARPTCALGSWRCCAPHVQGAAFP